MELIHPLYRCSNEAEGKRLRRWLFTYATYLAWHKIFGLMFCSVTEA